MISTHTSSDSAPSRLARGWKTAECSTVDELGWLILASTWSPIVWKGGRRLQERFLSSHFLALDFDSPEYPLAHAMRSFQGMTHLIGTTRSHQKEKGGVKCDRYRVVVPWSEPITDLDVYRHNVCLAQRRYEHADSACKDGARAFFACGNVVEIEDDGEPWDVEPLPVETRVHPSAKYAPRRHFSPFAVRCLETVIPLRTRNDACFRLGCEFSRLGFGFDDAVARICASPTYAQTDMSKEHDLFAEIEKCVRNGFKAEAVK